VTHDATHRVRDQDAGGHEVALDTQYVADVNRGVFGAPDCCRSTPR
jgi:hypothetical protein